MSTQGHTGAGQGPWDDDELVGVEEVARRLGVGPSTVYAYRNRPTTTNPFPAPDVKIDGRTWRWWWGTIRKWNEARPGPGGRPDLARDTAPAAE